MSELQQGEVYATDVYGSHQDDTREMAIDFASGIVGGKRCAGVLAGHPLDTVKVRLQNQTASGIKYTSTFNCITRIIKEEGFKGLYKGMASPLVGVAVINSLLFGVYGTALRAFSSDDQATPTLSAIFLAGSVSGFVNSFFSCPMELVKIRLQNQKDRQGTPSGYPVYKGPMDCCQQIYKKNGFRGFYKGFVTTMIRETPSYGAYFASYDILCKLLIPEGASDAPSMRLMLAGGLAGVVGWLSTYPADVVKTRLQSVEQEVKPTYRGLIDCVRHIRKTEGITPLFSGLGATAIRAFPTNAVTFYAVTIVKNYLSQESD